jgi:hypothetical protein
MSYTATPTSSVEITTCYAVFPFMAQQSLVGQDLLIIVAARSHSEARQSARLLWTRNRPDAEAADNTQQPQETDMGTADGIRTHNPSERPQTFALGRMATGVAMEYTILFYV